MERPSKLRLELLKIYKNTSSNAFQNTIEEIDLNLLRLKIRHNITVEQTLFPHDEENTIHHILEELDTALAILVKALDYES